MKTKLLSALQKALQSLNPEIDLSKIEIERSRNHGDFASNIAMKYAKDFASNPKALAEKIILALGDISGVAKIEIAGAGFINFYLSEGNESALLKNILQAGENFGRQNLHQKKILLEFVSANPNGPLHVGHGRGAAYGASLANVLRAVGYQVDCEYYVNDAGRQMDILTLSVYWRYAQLFGAEEALPAGVYQGEYVKNIAAEVKQKYGDKLVHSLNKIIPDFANDEDNRDAWIDSAISALRQLLGAKYEDLFNIALNCELSDIQDDLQEFKVEFQNYYSEKSLFTTGKIDAALAVMQKNGYLYEQNGALWFKASNFGDEKDRVVRRENGITTYFASDIAYHHDKFERGYDLMIDIFGADHHGYMARVQASLEALGHNPERLKIQLVQFAVLYQNGEKIQMSTRSGQFVTLRELRNLVGSDAARFFYVMRKPDQHLDFDLDLATAHSKDNPFYYVEYAHARCCRVLDKANPEDKKFNLEALPDAKLLKEAAEQNILRELERYPEVIAQAADLLAPHLIVNYLRELASAWHQYYDAGHKVLHEDEALRHARIMLTTATKQVLANGLKILGVSALEQM